MVSERGWLAAGNRSRVSACNIYLNIEIETEPVLNN